MALQPRTRLFTTDAYEAMGSAGIPGKEDRVELIEGTIVDMVPIAIGHARQVTRLNKILIQRLGDRALVSPQNPVRLSDRSEPQPDLVSRA